MALALKIMTTGENGSPKKISRRFDDYNELIEIYEDNPLRLAVAYEDTSLFPEDNTTVLKVKLGDDLIEHLSGKTFKQLIKWLKNPKAYEEDDKKTISVAFVSQCPDEAPITRSFEDAVHLLRLWDDDLGGIEVDGVTELPTGDAIVTEVKMGNNPYFEPCYDTFEDFITKLRSTLTLREMSKTKTLFAKVGVEITLTKAEMDQFIVGIMTGNCEELLMKLLTNPDKIKLKGETIVPGSEDEDEQDKPDIQYSNLGDGISLSF